MLRVIILCSLMVSLLVSGCSAPAKQADWSPTNNPNWANEPTPAEETSFWTEHPWVKPTLIGAGVGVATFAVCLSLLAVAVAGISRQIN
ncbi:hypothetical protein AYO44_02585 [Planctomycetaceae bacterium SCGC AG-212-F19]|nr:hypothetical protein AYO44_02585 [Planctomycetaceae bacterium SCGC AG-212-F19]